jgi:signal transduction histidine kinase
VRISQTLKSASFKLAAAYVILFALSVGVLAIVTYFSVMGELEQQFRGRIETEARALERVYRLGGRTGLLRDISERQRGHLPGGMVYGVFDAGNHALAGSLPAVPCGAGWTVLKGPPDGDEAPGQLEQLRVLVSPLPGGTCLLVGDDWGVVQDSGAVILKVFLWVSALSLTLAVAGGLILSGEFLKRIETFTRTAEAIIEGDMQRRVPRRAAPDDLDRLAATLNRMLDRTNHLMDSLKHLSNDIAHDLRTPLGRLRRNLDSALQAQAPPGEYRQVIEQSLAEVDRILDLFGAMLRIAQIESGSRKSGFYRFDLSCLVADTCESFAPSFEEEGKCVVEVIEPDIWILGDPELVTLSLANLLENAHVHTPTGTRVTVSVKRNGKTVSLSVADNGAGVPEVARFQIFQRFFRLEASRTTAGNGLGLSIVAAVADLHGAQLLTQDNQPGLKVDMRFQTAA